jgi:hypothetical protein
MRRLRDAMDEIIQHLKTGTRLIGPVRVSNATGHCTRTWGFTDGRRANKVSVDALAARGIILIHDDGVAREAVLAEGTDRAEASVRSLATASPSD